MENEAPSDYHLRDVRKWVKERDRKKKKDREGKKEKRGKKKREGVERRMERGEGRQQVILQKADFLW